MKMLSGLYSGESALDFPRMWRRAAIGSAAAVFVGLLSFVVLGLNLGLDFEGGTSYEVQAPEASVADVRSVLADLDATDARVQLVGDDRVLVRSDVQDPARAAELREGLEAELGEVIAFEQVGPTWGDGYLYKAAKKGAPPLCDGTDGGPICYPNIFDNASNLVRLHYYSEFVPVELEHMRGKTRANIPILGQVSDSRGFHSHCVGLGNSTSPINELIAEYGKLWDQEIWECSTRECGHIYDPTMDGKSMSIEELFEKEELTWRCPKCKMNKPNEEWSDEQKRTTLPHVDMKFTYRRRPATDGAPRTRDSILL